MSNSAKFLEAADAADRAADACGTQEELARTMEALRYMEEIQIAMMNQALAGQAKTSLRRKELLPLRESGDDFGRVEARIPKNLAFSLMKQKNFGFDGFTSDEGMRDFLKEYPQFGVKTVTGKTVVGYTGKSKGQRRTAKVNFGPGVLNLAT